MARGKLLTVLGSNLHLVSNLTLEKSLPEPWFPHLHPNQMAQLFWGIQISFIYLFILILWLHSWQMEIPRAGTESELQLQPELPQSDS